MAGLSALVEARDAGATLLRTIWNGFGDDGCFEHILFKDGKGQEFHSDDFDDAVNVVVDQNDIIVDGMMDGSVGILEIDLLTGKGRFWDAQQANEEERFAEFLLRCEWAGAAKVGARVAFSRDDDGCLEQAVSDESADSWQETEDLNTLLTRLIYRADYCECGDELTETIRQECGTDVLLEVDVPERTFRFSGQGKHVVVKVPADALELSTFLVDLDGTAEAE